MASRQDGRSPGAELDHWDWQRHLPPLLTLQVIGKQSIRTEINENRLAIGNGGGSCRTADAMGGLQLAGRCRLAPTDLALVPIQRDRLQLPLVQCSEIDGMAPNAGG